MLMSKSYIYHFSQFKFECSLQECIRIKISSSAPQQTLMYVGSLSFNDLPSEIKSQYSSIEQFFTLFSKESCLQVNPVEGKFLLALEKKVQNQQGIYEFRLDRVQSIKLTSECQTVQTTEFNEHLMKREKRNPELFPKKKMCDKIIQDKDEELELCESEISLTELTSPFKQFFTIKNAFTTYKGPNYQWRHILMKRQINWEKVDKFQCRIVKTKGRRIFLGVADYKLQKDEKFSHLSGNAVCLWGVNGRIYYGNVEEEKFIETKIGFVEGQRITVSVDLQNGEISWSVGNEERGRVKAEILQEKRRKFVPFADFYNEGDCIEWLQ